MAIENQDDQNVGPPAASQPHDAGINSKGASRRRFAFAGGAILTLTSASGMATTLNCVAPSGTLSAVGSAELNGLVVACNGGSPTFWQGNSWPSTVPATTLFGSVFPRANSELAETAMSALIAGWTQGVEDGKNLARHFTATYLNIKSGRINFIDVPGLIKIWNDLADGSYNPSAGVTWDAARVIEYLENTYTHQ